MIAEFSEFTNCPAAEELDSLINAGRLPNALVFEGEATRVLSLAKLTACALLCKAAAPPCGRCDVCRKVMTGHADVKFVTPVDERATIGVDVVREMRADVYILPNDGEKKVYIIEKPMTAEAQNAFLKIFEEPPERVTFIILCPSKDTLLETILSRASVFAVAGGGENDEAAKIAGEMAICLKKGDKYAFLVSLSSAGKEKTLRAQSLLQLKTILRDAAAIKAGHEALTSCEAANELSRRFSNSAINALCEKIDYFYERCVQNPYDALFNAVICAGLFGEIQ